jgi:hypothetical protein
LSRLGCSEIDGYWTSSARESATIGRLLEGAVPNLTFEADRGIPDLNGEGEALIATTCLSTVSGVKFTPLRFLGPPTVPGVVGREGSGLLRFGLLELLDNVGIEEGASFDFFKRPGYLRIDLTRSNFPGLRKKLLDSDLGILLKLFAVVNLARPRGVALRFGFDGDLDNVGI